MHHALVIKIDYQKHRAGWEWNGKKHERAVSFLFNLTLTYLELGVLFIVFVSWFFKTTTWNDPPSWYFFSQVFVHCFCRQKGFILSWRVPFYRISWRVPFYPHPISAPHSVVSPVSESWWRTILQESSDWTLYHYIWYPSIIGLKYCRYDAKHQTSINQAILGIKENHGFSTSMLLSKKTLQDMPNSLYQWWNMY